MADFLACISTAGWQRVLIYVTASCGIAFFLVSMWRINRDENQFRIVDLLLEGNPPKASVNKLTLLVFAALAVWLTVLAVLSNRMPWQEIEASLAHLFARQVRAGETLID